MLTPETIAKIIDPVSSAQLDIVTADCDTFRPLFDGLRRINELIGDLTSAEWWATAKPTITVYISSPSAVRYARFCKITTPADLIALQQAHFDLYTNI